MNERQKQEMIDEIASYTAGQLTRNQVQFWINRKQPFELEQINSQLEDIRTFGYNNRKKVVGDTIVALATIGLSTQHITLGLSLVISHALSILAGQKLGIDLLVQQIRRR